jgi:hypothetical protein
VKPQKEEPNRIIAVRSSCKIFSTEDPNVSIERVLETKQVTRIWEDFEPYPTASCCERGDETLKTCAGENLHLGGAYVAPSISSMSHDFGSFT